MVDGIRAGDFWIFAPSEAFDEQVRAKAESLLKRENPTYVRAVAGVERPGRSTPDETALAPSTSKPARERTRRRQLMQRYMVISSDCHAGLPNLQYKDWLDAKYHDAFDEEQRGARRRSKQELRARGMRNEEFAEAWERDNEEGLRGGWDAARRDKELDADGVAGEVIFPDADAVTSGASAPFGAGLGQGGDRDPELLLAGAQAHNRWLAELCADSPVRRAGVAIVPILHDVDAAVAEITRAAEAGSARRNPHPVDVAALRRRTTTLATTRCGRRARTSTCRCTCTRVRPTRSRTASSSACTSPRSAGGRPARCGSCSGRASSSSSPTSGSS